MVALGFRRSTNHQRANLAVVRIRQETITDSQIGDIDGHNTSRVGTATEKADRSPD